MIKQPDRSNYLYCAFLRGVNVKGTSMKMKEVCTLFENNGMTNVNSILASGNILFSSGKPRTELKEILEKALSSHFDYDAFLFLKNKKELENIINSNPFEPNTNFHIYVFLGIDGIENLLKKEFEQSKKATGEEGAMVDSTFYWKVPKGSTLDSEFSKILGQKKLKNTLTSRNINTIVKVLQKIK
ncbi:Uncharacterized conserved protein, DUF1697 family [Sphingobacterium nematocida]|uniref:Uncharacterized conserved protein, DUF1697 family n=1 Tax=Sphingobacterium nematocida TaxID=1513896 RepID=A0A1T5GAI6_9SPHI|nr:DUF1697 domain-containing protein [Sphingobacterium nematocida]SKC05372.1 Uncharacterized conserved protein, DUF1697 family [Sphingobacterium nematocida]